MSRWRTGSGNTPRGVLMLAFAAPLASLGVPLILGTADGPTRAQAGISTDLEAEPAVAAPQPSEAALARAAELRVATLPPISPLRPASEMDHSLPVVADSAAMVPDEPVAQTPLFTVSAVMKDAEGRAMAVVNGKLHSVGSDLGQGWSITAIDVNARTVTFGNGKGLATSASLATAPVAVPPPR